MLFENTVRRLYFHLAFHFYAKQKISKTDHVKLLGFSFEVPPTVFHPNLYFSSKFLGEHLRTLDLRGKKVLDVGCGSGVLSIIGASRGASVTSIDINPVAVGSTRQNAIRNGVASSITAMESDLFNALPDDQYFDFIFLNPPFYSGEVHDMTDHAWRGGKNFEFIYRFSAQARRFLEAEGKIIFILSSDMDVEKIKGIFEREQYLVRFMQLKKFLFETLYIFHAVPSS